MIKFPEGFLWGAATSSHQVEGDNLNNDWWEWENQSEKRHKSGQACGHYKRYTQDFDLAKSLNHNAHRFSVEWSRIEPREGEFDDREIVHYKDVVRALKDRGIEPVVTLHHFTNPVWFSKKGGWENPDSVRLFSRYAGKMADALPGVKYWLTINEPMVYVYHSYLVGIWPPQKKSIFAVRAVTVNMAQAHIRAYREMRDIYKNQNLSAPEISIAQHFRAFVPCTGSLRDRIAAGLRSRIFNYYFLNKLAKARTLDFIGVNYYTRDLVHTRGWGLDHLTGDICDENHYPAPKNSLGWDIYPEGFYSLLMRLKKYNLPVMITENGICSGDDAQRWEFIRLHLSALGKAMSEGANVLGYLYWSLLDNFEWHEGFGPRFGLVEVDYATLKRTARESAKKFACLCAQNALE